jgi:hypothetical protein
MIAIVPIALLALLVISVLEHLDGRGASAPKSLWME